MPHFAAGSALSNQSLRTIAVGLEALGIVASSDMEFSSLPVLRQAWQLHDFLVPGASEGHNRVVKP